MTAKLKNDTALMYPLEQRNISTTDAMSAPAKALTTANARLEVAQVLSWQDGFL